MADTERPVAAAEPGNHQAHGIGRPDEYRWLADQDDPRTLDYLRAERAYYERHTTQLAPLRADLLGELTARIPANDMSVPWVRFGYKYFTQVEAGQEYRNLYRIDPRDGRSHLVLDLNHLAANADHLELAYVEPSPDGRLLAYALDSSGDERFELRFRDLTSGQDLADTVPNAGWSGAWAADSAHFAYTVPDEAHRSERIRCHRLGTAATDDHVVLTEPDHRFDLDLRSSLDGQWLIISSNSRDTSECHLVPAQAPTSAPILVTARQDQVEYSVAVMGGGWDGRGADQLLSVSNRTAPEFELQLAPLPLPGRPIAAEEWRPVAKVTSRQERLESVLVLGSYLILQVIWQGEPFLRVFARGPASANGVADGQGPGSAREIHPGLPAGQLRLWRALDAQATTVTIVEENLITPPRWVQIDLTNGERRVVKRTDLPGVDPTRYRTERIQVPAADGAMIPITVAYPRDAAPTTDGQPGQPLLGCLLNGYGAYEVGNWPDFSLGTLSLLDRGVCYAVAHVRGGGELGRTWWEQGRLANKQNSFSDFEAARAGLVAAGLAGPGGAVVSRGGSAGGLLVGAAYSQWPQSWAGVVAEVPFVDVVTTMSDAELPLTPGEWREWGDPIGSAEDFRTMLAYSPYDNPPPPARRPPLLVTGAVHDPRVLVHEPAKWVARLRATDDPGRPSEILFRVETGDGSHSGPSGRYREQAYEAEILSWILEKLGTKPDCARAEGGPGGQIVT